MAFNAATLMDKLDKQEHFVVATEQIEEKLAKLAQAFEDLAKGKKHPTPEDVIDMEYREIESSPEVADSAIFDGNSEEEEHALPDERSEELPA